MILSVIAIEVISVMIDQMLLSIKKPKNFPGIVHIVFFRVFFISTTGELQMGWVLLQLLAFIMPKMINISFFDMWI